MKLRLLTFLLLGFFSSLQSQNLNIPDPNFKESLVTSTVLLQMAKDLNGNYVKIDTNGDGEIQINEAENLSYLKVSSRNIGSLVGIEKFVNLTYLDCSVNANGLTNIDFSGNTKLLTIEAFANYQLKTINVSNNILLKKLNLGANAIQEIDISKNTELVDFTIDGTFTNLDCSHNTKLNKIFIRSNSLSNINLNNCGELTDAFFSSDSLTLIDLTPIPKVNKLDITLPALTNLDLSANVLLNSLTSNGSSVSVINLSNNHLLKNLYVYSAINLGSLDLSANILLENLTILDTSLHNIDISPLNNLKRFEMSGNSVMKTIDATQNSNLNIFNVLNCSALEKVLVKNGKVQDFYKRFLNCPNLRYICCDEEEKQLFMNNPNYTVVTDCSLLSANNLSGSLPNIAFYPNPPKDIIYFTEKVNYIFINDVSGKLIKNIKLSGKELNISYLKTGNYILIINTNNGLKTAKLIKN